MSQNPCSQFFWNDWQQEPGLRICCLAARGLWMEALCVMARARPAGYLRIGNRQCTVSDLATIAGDSEETVCALLEELRRNEVFSITRDGTIYSRRMVREASISAKRAKAGHLGGLAKARADKANLDLLRQVPRQNPSKTLAPLTPIPLETESDSTVGDSFRSEVTSLVPALESKRAPPNGIAAAATLDLDALFYQRGKALLGRSSGGQLTKLRMALGGVGPALDEIEKARHKECPAEYIARIIRSHATRPAEDDKAWGLYS
jgi:hypothetical protein